MQDSTLYRVDPDTLSLMAKLRLDAIRFVMASGEQAYPALYARLDERGRTACAEDIGFHLDFLLPALESGDLAPFRAYLAWLSQVLTSRGIPTLSLARSIDDLGVFFQRQLGDAVSPALAAIADARSALNGDAPSYDCPRPASWAESEAYRDAALRGNYADAQALVVAAMQREQSLPRTSMHVVQRALYEIGALWQQNAVSVAQEHMATAMSQTILAQQMANVSIAPDNGLSALFACTAGNHHALGLRMVADAFEIDGWKTYFLGADTPTAALINAVAETRPRLVGLSISLPQHVRGLREAVSALRSHFGNACPKLFVGGLVFNQFPQLAHALGADLLGTDADSAVAQARRLLLDGST